MAPASSTARRPARSRLAMPGKGGKTKGGPKPVGGGAAGGRPRPNRLLLGVLGLVALAAVGRVAMPGLFGGGGHAAVSFTTPLTDRHFGAHVTPTTVAGGTTATTGGRPVRDPFTPQPGYGSS